MAYLLLETSLISLERNDAPRDERQAGALQSRLGCAFDRAVSQDIVARIRQASRQARYVECFSRSGFIQSHHSTSLTIPNRYRTSECLPDRHLSKMVWKKYPRSCRLLPPPLPTPQCARGQERAAKEDEGVKRTMRAGSRQSGLPL